MFVLSPTSGGIYNMTAEGETSWYEFAKAILEEASSAKLHIFRGSTPPQRECRCSPSESSPSRPQNIPRQLAAPHIPCFRRDASTIALAFVSLPGARNCDPCSSRILPKIATTFNRTLSNLSSAKRSRKCRLPFSTALSSGTRATSS